MYLVDNTYFIRELRIPNIDETDVSGGTDTFEMWIDQYGRQLPKDALGNTLFADFDTNVVSGVYVPGVTKWDNLVNGLTYTYQGVSYRWDGLLFTQGTYKGSVLAYFIYAKWLEFQLSRQSGVGEVRGKAANSDSVNSTTRYVSIWNTFVEMYQGNGTTDGTVSFIRGVPFFDYAGTTDTYVSLIEFLKHNEADYPDAQLKCYELKNTFGLS